jgi:hypothetical protein
MASPTITQNANPVVNVYTVPHPPSPGPAHPVVSPLPPRASSHVILSNQRNLRAEFHGGQEGTEAFIATNAPTPGDLSCAVACFRNEPVFQGENRDALNVRAQLIYRTIEGQEMGNGIARASWLGMPLDMVDLPLGHTQCVLLGVVDNDGSVSNLSKTREPTHYGDKVKTHVYNVEVMPCLVELRLISGNKVLLAPIFFDLFIENGDLRVNRHKE